MSEMQGKKLFFFDISVYVILYKDYIVCNAIILFELFYLSDFFHYILQSIHYFILLSLNCRLIVVSRLTLLARPNI